MEFRGDKSLLDAEITIIAGSRRCSDYGRRMAVEYALALNDGGHVVALSLGAGVTLAAADALARNGAQYILATSHGLLDPSPPHMVDAVAGAALLVSPIRTGSGSAQRLRMGWEYLVDIADQMVLIEGAPTDDAMEFAWLAIESRLPLYAVPGPVSSHHSRGPNNLIATGDAQAISNPNMLARGSRSRTVHHTIEEN